MKKILSFILIVVAISLFTGCDNIVDSDNGYTVIGDELHIHLTIKEINGNYVVLEDNEKDRLFNIHSSYFTFIDNDEYEYIGIFKASNMNLLDTIVFIDLWYKDIPYAFDRIENIEE